MDTVMVQVEISNVYSVADGGDYKACYHARSKLLDIIVVAAVMV